MTVDRTHRPDRVYGRHLFTLKSLPKDRLRNTEPSREVSFVFSKTTASYTQLWKVFKDGSFKWFYSTPIHSTDSPKRFETILKEFGLEGMEIRYGK